MTVPSLQCLCLGTLKGRLDGMSRSKLKNWVETGPLWLKPSTQPVTKKTVWEQLIDITGSQHKLQRLAIMQIMKTNGMHTLNFMPDTNLLVYGQLQSGKTNFVLSSSWLSTQIRKRPVVVVLRNIRADLSQFLVRAREFNKRIEAFNSEVDFRTVSSLNQLCNEDNWINPQGEHKCCVALANYRQLDKIISFLAPWKKLCDFGTIDPEIDPCSIILENYVTLGPNDKFVCISSPDRVKGHYQVHSIDTSAHTDRTKRIVLTKRGRRFRSGTVWIREFDPTKIPAFDLIIDEIDFTQKDNTLGENASATALIQEKCDMLKQMASFVIGITATPAAILLGDRYLKNVMMLKPPSNYIGLKQLRYRDVLETKRDCLVEEDPNIDRVYDNFLRKDEGIILHNTADRIVSHKEIASHLYKKFPLTVLVHNSRGIAVICSAKYQLLPTDTPGYRVYGKRSSKKWLGYSKQLYRNLDEPRVHYVRKLGIANLLELLKIDANRHNATLTHSHIAIVSGMVAGRGLSYVNASYTRHITDQYLQPGNSSGEKLLQYVRCCGIFSDNKPPTLWISEFSAMLIRNQAVIVQKLIKSCVQEKGLSIRDIIEHTKVEHPLIPLTRPRVMKGVLYLDGCFLLAN